MIDRKKMIAANVTFIRKSRGLSTIELGQLTHLGKSTINDIERCRQSKPIDHYIEVLAQGLGVDADVLTEDNPEIIAKFDSLKSAILRNEISDATVTLANEMITLTAQRGPAEKFKALKLRGDISFFQVEYKEALTYYEQLFRITEITKDQDQLHSARHSIASCYLQLGKFEKVKSIIDLDLEEIKKPSFRAKDYQALGVMYKRQTDYIEAEKAYMLALDEFSKDTCDEQAQSVARTYQWLGDLYRELCLYDKAIEFSNQAVDRAQMVRDKLIEVYAKRTIALVFIKQRLFDQALIYLSEVKGISQNMNGSDTENMVTEFYTVFCSTRDFFAMRDLLEKLSSREVPPREMASMYEMAADRAMEIEELKYEAQKLYKHALRLLYT